MAAAEKKVYLLLLDKERSLTEMLTSTSTIVDARSYQSLCYRNFITNKDEGNIHGDLIYNLKGNVNFTLKLYESRMFDLHEKDNFLLLINDSNQYVGILSDDLEKLKKYDSISSADPALGKIQSKKSKKKKSKGRKKKSKK